MKLFKRKDKNFYAVANGQTIPIEEVPDEVFSTKMMGEGIAIIPNEGKVYAPCDGIITVVMEPSKHAIGIKNNEGREILIHVGLDTVNLLGEGFTTYVSVKDKVKKGDLLITFDKQVLLDKGMNDMIMIVIVDSKGHTIKKTFRNQNVIIKETPIITYE